VQEAQCVTSFPSAESLEPLSKAQIKKMEQAKFKEEEKLKKLAAGKGGQEMKDAVKKPAAQ
jgi:hypothetical protein